MAEPGLLVVDNALDHGFYRPVEHWARAAGSAPASVHPPGGQPLPDPDRFSHIIVSGSEARITELDAWAAEEARWLAAAVAAGAAVLGSCWGHQLIAVALAGPAAVRASPSPEFGWADIEVLDRDELLPAGPLAAFVSHFDEVVPGCHPALRPLARSPGCAVQAMRWADAPVWGVQAHPEVDPESGRGFLSGACALWPQHTSRFERGLAGPVKDSAWAPALVARFLRAGPRAG